MILENPELEILLPVHNEGDSIDSVIREIYSEIFDKLEVQFIVCEDGSTDNTEDVLKRLEKIIPMKLIMSKERKGYSQAVKDGMAVLTAPYLLCLDSDGQCNPKDFWQFWDLREKYDVLLGWRVARADVAWRKLSSRLFFYIYQFFYHVPVHDPSCPYVLAHKRVVERISPEMGEMQQGFWWEFIARVHRRRFSITELPIQHRIRFAGITQVYKLRKLPGIGYQHFIALFKVWLQTRS